MLLKELCDKYHETKPCVHFKAPAKRRGFFVRGKFWCQENNKTVQLSNHGFHKEKIIISSK